MTCPTCGAPRPTEPATQCNRPDCTTDTQVYEKIRREQGIAAAIRWLNDKRPK